MTAAGTYDFVVIGAGSAGCVAAAELARRGAGTVCVVEAGPSERWPLVRMPFGLIWLMGSRRDWRYRSAPMAGIGGRSIAIPRGRMVGGSGSINSMVWFRGRRDDFDGWRIPGWTWAEVEAAFEAVEERIAPRRLATPHPLTERLGNLLPANDQAPTPEYESAGVCRYNLHGGRRRSSADAFLRPAEELDRVQVIQASPVKRIVLQGDRARSVELQDGMLLSARKGIMLSAGSIGSPEILMGSGIGPAEDLRAAGIDPIVDAPQVGANLHDHPGAGLHYAGPGSGYGLVPGQAWQWISAPWRWLAAGTGVFASPTVEGSAFIDSSGSGGVPDIQSHFIPFMSNWTGKRYRRGTGYFADAVLCRPKSRGRLTLTRDGLSIDLGLFADPSDLDTLTAGWLRIRAMMAEADLGPHKAPEVYPGTAVMTEEQARDHVRSHAATAYHPVGTLALGGPVTPRLAVKGVERLWVADASVMPNVTSANTNAPSMMIGYRAAELITEDAA